MEWQPIESHAGKYEVSSTGLVRNNKGKIIGQWPNDQGYMVVRLSSPRVMKRVHRLVAQAFLPNPECHPVVNHIDCNVSNNNLENLEWCTQARNLAHAVQLGRLDRGYWAGKRSPNAALSSEVVQQIRAARSEEGASWQKIATKFGVSKRTVGRIVNGETYV